MCGQCDREQRVCPQGHTQEKNHGDVFRGPVLCDTCGEPTAIEERS